MQIRNFRVKSILNVISPQHSQRIRPSNLFPKCHCCQFRATVGTRFYTTLLTLFRPLPPPLEECTSDLTFLAHRVCSASPSIFWLGLAGFAVRRRRSTASSCTDYAFLYVVISSSSASYLGDMKNVKLMESITCEANFGFTRKFCCEVCAMHTGLLQLKTTYLVWHNSLS